MSEERAFLIEKGDQPEYVTFCHLGGGPEFTTDNMKATRFCRREDADGVAALFEFEDVRIVEHAWGLAEPELAALEAQFLDASVRLSKKVERYSYLRAEARAVLALHAEIEKRKERE